MLKYPGTSYNVYREQLAAYSHLQRKVSQAKLGHSPYHNTQSHPALPVLFKGRCESEKQRELIRKNHTLARRLNKVECRTSRYHR